MDLSLEDRIANKEKLIKDLMVQNYYGRVVISKSPWNQLQKHIESYLAMRENLNLRQPDLALGDDQDSELNRVMEEVLLRNPLSKFPTDPTFKLDVLDWLSQHLSLSSSSALALELKELQNRGAIKEDDFIFKSFDRVGDGCFVTLLEENNIISQGTTGLTSWQGACALFDWIMSKEKNFEGKRILELGSGCGLAGISLLKRQALESYTFTDCHSKVLDAIKFNVRLNFQDDLADQCDLDQVLTRGPPQSDQDFNLSLLSGPKLSVRCLDWVTARNEDLKEAFVNQVDIIMGADIVYERSLIEPLVRVIQIVLDLNPKTVAFIACTERSKTTIECFENALAKANLLYKIIHKMFYSPEESLLCSDVQHQASTIYEIKAKE